MFLAIGSRPASRIVGTTKGIDVDEKGYVIVGDRPKGMTTRRGVFAGGDVVHRPQTVVLAMKAAKEVAVPGTSEHQLGLAVDIIDTNNWNLDESQESMPTQQWLIANSWRYGFILRYPNGTTNITGIIYEPWHYRYVGCQVAKEIYERGITLEEYLGRTAH